ncbi:MAG: hypothetical protein COA74_05710 [Gammaproteobacteria bacterium]|nr:MAG: hypothetical protein COA74_05710 [Gammaproteobacteria bacterium]
MPDLEEKENCYLISIETTNRDALFDCYRDYLVFMSLVRDGVRSCEFKVYGFCWLKKQSLMLIQPNNKSLGDGILRLLKRYHFWLLQRGPTTTEFKLQIAPLKKASSVLDCLRFLHQKAVNEKIVDDAMDYHWHSHHVYSGFWSVNWLRIDYVLDKFASNRLVAMNRFRQYMLNRHCVDFNRLLEVEDCSHDYISINATTSSLSFNKQSVAEVNSHYHQSLLNRTRIDFTATESGQLICISVVAREKLRLIN